MIGHFDEVIQLQRYECCCHAHEFKSGFVAVLPLATLKEQLRVHCQAQTKQRTEISDHTSKRCGVQMDPVWVSTPYLGLSDRPHWIDV